MLRAFRLALFASLGVALTGCATLVGGGSSQSVSIASTPSDALFSIKSSSGLQMASGRTPQTISLPRKNDYQIDFSVPGYRSRSLPLIKGVNGWVFGNFVFGWIPGLIIDFMTGSANKLEPAIVQVSLERGLGASDGDKVFALVRQLSSGGGVISEQRIQLEPVQ